MKGKFEMFVRSNYLVIFALVLLLFSAGCVSSAVQVTSTAAPILIRVGYSSDKDLGDIPSLMAHERLSKQGYQIEPTFYASPDLAMAAAAEGKTDIIYGGPKTMWLAADKGAPLTLIGEQNASTLLVEVVDSIQTCADLADKPFGIHSEAATTTSMLKRYLQDNCPGTQPQFIVVAGSDNRAAGLLAGQLQAAVLEVADAVQLELKTPG
jgi:ABC-type nitrate/sulfonate/bicarbonate transport system substrate-binding protein